MPDHVCTNFIVLQQLVCVASCTLLWHRAKCDDRYGFADTWERIWECNKSSFQAMTTIGLDKQLIMSPENYSLFYQCILPAMKYEYGSMWCLNATERAMQRVLPLLDSHLFPAATVSGCDASVLVCVSNIASNCLIVAFECGICW